MDSGVSYVPAICVCTLHGARVHATLCLCAHFERSSCDRSDRSSTIKPGDASQAAAAQWLLIGLSQVTAVITVNGISIAVARGRLKVWKCRRRRVCTLQLPCARGFNYNIARCSRKLPPSTRKTRHATHAMTPCELYIVQLSIYANSI